MLMQEERELVVEYGKKMSAARLSTGTSGNISIYNAEKGLVALSPSGMDYFSTTPEDVVILDLDGKVVDGKRKPSSEWALHTTFYKHKPHARAVVHTHSVYCTTLAVLGEPIRAVHYVIGDAGAAEVPCAPYQLFGTEALAEAAMEVCGKSDGVLLGNHGLVCCGKDIKGAYGLACNLEYIAEIQCRAMSIGKPNVLTEEQMAEVMVKFQSYGQPGAKKPDIERSRACAHLTFTVPLTLCLEKSGKRKPAGMSSASAAAGCWWSTAGSLPNAPACWTGSWPA